MALVHIPEIVHSIFNKRPVVLILPFSCPKRRMSRFENKQDDSNSEQIDIFAKVTDSVIENLRSLIAFRADFGSLEATAVSAIELLDKAEINEFYFVILTEKNVLRLQVSVGKAHFMDVIDSREHLLKIVLAFRFAEGTRVCDIVE